MGRFAIETFIKENESQRGGVSGLSSNRLKCEILIGNEISSDERKKKSKKEQ